MLWTDTVAREKAEREANDFTAEIISTTGTPAQRMMIAAAAERMGCVPKGTDPIVDGRINSEVAHRLVGRAIAYAERAGQLRHHRGGNRRARRAASAQNKKLRLASLRETQIVTRGEA